jgi:hypothetical protein
MRLVSSGVGHGLRKGGDLRHEHIKHDTTERHGDLQELAGEDIKTKGAVDQERVELR